MSITASMSANILKPTKKFSSTKAAATRQHIWMSVYKDKPGKRAARAERMNYLV